MFSYVALNAFCQSTFDQSFVVDEIGVPSINENDIDDNNMLELDIFRSLSTRIDLPLDEPLEVVEEQRTWQVWKCFDCTLKLSSPALLFTTGSRRDSTRLQTYNCIIVNVFPLYIHCCLRLEQTPELR